MVKGDVVEVEISHIGTLRLAMEKEDQRNFRPGKNYVLPAENSVCVLFESLIHK